MKLKELITKLLELEAKHGNLPVKILEEEQPSKSFTVEISYDIEKFVSLTIN